MTGGGKGEQEMGVKEKRRDSQRERESKAEKEMGMKGKGGQHGNKGRWE